MLADDMMKTFPQIKESLEIYQNDSTGNDDFDNHLHNKDDSDQRVFEMILTF